MKTSALRKIGNSQGIILDKTILDLVEANRDDAVFKVEIKNGKIVLSLLTKAEQKKVIHKTAQSVAKKQSKILKKLAQ